MLNFRKEHICGTFSSDKTGLLFSENNEKRKKKKQKTMRNTKTKQEKPVFTEEACMLLLTRPREENQWRLNCNRFP